MPRRNRFKTTKVLTEEEAYAQIIFVGFYYDVYNTVYHAVEEDLCARFVNDPSLEKKFNRSFKKLFDQIYYGDWKVIYRKYKRRYEKGTVKHTAKSFFMSVVRYLDDEIENKFLGENRTEGFGAIY